MEYSISQTEIIRRKRAYLTLSTSTILGMWLGSLYFRFFIPIPLYIASLVAFLLIGIFSFRFFVVLLKTKMYFDDHYLVKKSKSQSEKYALSAIEKVEVKWTSQKTIREVYIHLHNRKLVVVTALNDFGKFKDLLIEKLDKKVVVADMREHVEYDHPLFYIVLGLLLGLVCVFCFVFLENLELWKMKMGLLILSAYSASLGAYFFIFKPTSKRSGVKTKFLDYIAGVALVLAGVYCLLVAWNYF